MARCYFFWKRSFCFNQVKKESFDEVSKFACRGSPLSDVEMVPISRVRLFYVQVVMARACCICRTICKRPSYLFFSQVFYASAPSLLCNFTSLFLMMKRNGIIFVGTVNSPRIMFPTSRRCEPKNSFAQSSDAFLFLFLFLTNPSPEVWL